MRRVPLAVQAAITAVALSLAHPASAQTVFPPTYVLSEQDTDGLRQCSLSHASAAAQASATLRYNNVPIQSRAALGTLTLYVNLNGGPTRDGWCSAHLSVELFDYNVVTLSTGARASAPIMLCSKATLSHGPAVEAQARLNSSVADFVNQCLVEYTTRLR